MSSNWASTRLAHLLPRGRQPGRPHDHGEIVDCPRKVLINNNIVEVPAVAHLLARGLQAGFDHLGRVLPPVFEALAPAIASDGGRMKMWTDVG